jgi:uncharacterized coiled-coil DUF342 family protein
MGEKERIDKLEAMFYEMNAKVDDIHKAMIGDDYGNNGYSHRIKRLEQKQKAVERYEWMILGGAAVISALVGFLTKIL